MRARTRAGRRSACPRGSSTWPIAPARCLCVAFVSALPWLPAAAGAEPFANASASVVYDDNLPRAADAADIRSDTLLRANGTLGWFEAPTGSGGLSATLGARAEAYARFDGLDNLGLDIGAAWKHKFGTGPDVGWLRVSGAAAVERYREDIRDGTRVDASAEFGRRFTPGFEASLGAAWDRRYASHDRPVVPGISGRAFSGSGLEGFVHAACDFTDRWQLAARVGVRRGDVVASTRPGEEIFEASKAIAADPAFGPDYYAYTIRGTTRRAMLNLSYALGDRASINLALAVARTIAYEDISYRERTATLQLVRSFP